MPVGLVAFELFFTASSSAAKRRLVRFRSLLRKNISKFSRLRPNVGTVLLTIVSIYLVCSRLGPVLSRVGESAVIVFELEQKLLDLEGLERFKNAYNIFRYATRVPGPFSRHPKGSSISPTMGNSSSRVRRRSSGNIRPPVRVPSDSGIKVKNVDDLGRIAPTAVTIYEDPVAEEQAPTPKEPPRSVSPFAIAGLGSESQPVKFSEIEDNISTGDLAVLYRGANETPHFAVFVQHDKCDPNFPLLLLKGKTKPLPLEKFNPVIARDAHTVSATTRIFYGDYRKVAIHHLLSNKVFKCKDILDIVDSLTKIPFSEKEVEAITNAPTPEERSAIVCTFMVAYFYKRLDVLNVDPTSVTPQSLIGTLQLSEAAYVKLPKIKEGPVASGDPPFLAKLVNGILPPPEVSTTPFGNIASDLDTGDLILFSGATSSGAIIKFFDHSQFSHIGLVLKSEYVSQLLVWEASTNKAGLVDVGSGKVRRGVELLPLTRKIFSGWYDQVAVRRLTGVDKEKRTQMYQDLLTFRKEVQGRPYEKDMIELILSAIDVQEKYLSFLRNTHEDLSSLFCSELVAEAYKRMGLLSTNKLSNEFTPDDFSSAKELSLNFGKLEPEVYIELKFDFQVGENRQSTAY